MSQTHTPQFGTTEPSEIQRLAERDRVRLARASTMKQGHGGVKAPAIQYVGE